MPFGLGDNLAALKVQIGADLTEFKKTASQMEKAVAPIANRLKAVGSNLSAFLTVPIVGLGAASLKTAADMEQLKNGLTAVLGDAHKAEKEFKALEKAAQLPGLGLEQAVRGSLQLQAVGFQAEFARQALSEFGNALAVSGGTPDDLQEVIRQLSQIRSLGKITAENFNVIRERVPLVGQAMQKAFGTTSIEAIRDAGVSADEFIRKLVEGLQEVPRAEGGLTNAFVNIRQAGVKALAALGNAINEAFNVEGLVTTFTAALGRLTETFQNLSPSARRFILVAGALAAAIGPVSLAIGGLVSALPVVAAGFAALTGPIGIAIGAIAAISIAVVSLSKQYESFSEFSRKIWGDIALSQIKSIDKMLAAYNSWLEFLGPVTAATRSLILEARKGLKDLGIGLESGGAQPLDLFNIFEKSTSAAREAVTKFKRAMDDVAAGTKGAGEETRKFAAAVNAVPILGPDNEGVLTRAQEGLWGMEAALRGVKNVAVQAAPELSKLTETVLAHTTSAVDQLANAIGGAALGFESFGDAVERVVRNVLADVASAIAKVLILKGLLTFIGGGTGFASSIVRDVAASSGVTSGFRAAAGSVSAPGAGAGSLSRVEFGDARLRGDTLLITVENAILDRQARGGSGVLG